MLVSGVLDVVIIVQIFHHIETCFSIDPGLITMGVTSVRQRTFDMEKIVFKTLFIDPGIL